MVVVMVMVVVGVVVVEAVVLALVLSVSLFISNLFRTHAPGIVRSHGDSGAASGANGGGLWEINADV